MTLKQQYKIPYGWQTFTAALPRTLYYKLNTLAEEESDLVAEVAYLLEYANR